MLQRCLIKIAAAAMFALTLVGCKITTDGNMTDQSKIIDRPPQLTTLDFREFGAPETSWFHPGVTVLPDGTWLATAQSINGVDYYGNPYFTFSKDRGKNWTKPQEIEGFKARQYKNYNLQLAVADIRPFTSPNDGTVFVFGCTTTYSPSGNTFWQKGEVPDRPEQRGVYVTYNTKTGWSDRKILPLPEYNGSYRAACTEVVFLPDNEVLVPIYLKRGSIQWGGRTSDKFAVVVAKYRQKGEELEYISMSPYIEGGAERGMIEPSAIALPEGGFALTIRAEDGHGYVCCSKDGTTWSERIFWHWDDEAGTPLIMSSTQQHWIRVGGRIYLVYTRDDGTNSKIFRYRAPLFLAEAIPSKGILKRATEQTVFPRQQINGGEALYGNFHCTQLTPDSALITDSGACNNKSRVMATMVTP